MPDRAHDVLAGADMLVEDTGDPVRCQRGCPARLGEERRSATMVVFWPECATDSVERQKRVEKQRRFRPERG
jgi:hypothetical protein